jgi:hypothetical protein
MYRTHSATTQKTAIFIPVTMRTEAKVLLKLKHFYTEARMNYAHVYVHYGLKKSDKMLTFNLSLTINKA